MKQELVISEPDIEAALNHLKTLPHRNHMPGPWERQRLLTLLSEKLGPSLRIGEHIHVAPGVFAIIKPFGIDLASVDHHDGRQQVWLLIRPGYTDPDKMTPIP